MKTTEIKSDVKSKVNGVAKNAKNSIQDTLDKTLEHAPEVMASVTAIGKSFLDSMNTSKEKIMESAVTSFQAVDKSVKSRPWAFVGGAVALGFVAGFLVGNGRKGKASSVLNEGLSALKSNADKIKDKIEQNINKVSEHLQ